MPGSFGNDVNKNRKDQTSKLSSIEGIVPLLKNPDPLSEDEPYLAEECSDDEGCMGVDDLRKLAWSRLLALRRAEAVIKCRDKKLAKARIIIKQLQALGLRACKGVSLWFKRAQLAFGRRLDGVQTSGAPQWQLLERIAALEDEKAVLAETVSDLELKLQLAALRTPQKRGLLCGICHQQAPDAVFRPCRHLVICFKCYNAEGGPDACPICGWPIEQEIGRAHV